MWYRVSQRRGGSECGPVSEMPAKGVHVEGGLDRRAVYDVTYQGDAVVAWFLRVLAPPSEQCSWWGVVVGYSVCSVSASWQS